MCVRSARQSRCAAGAQRCRGHSSHRHLLGAASVRHAYLGLRHEQTDRSRAGRRRRLWPEALGRDCLRLDWLVGGDLPETIQIAERYGFANASTHLAEALSSPGLEAVILSTPTPLHALRRFSAFRPGNRKFQGHHRHARNRPRTSPCPVRRTDAPASFGSVGFWPAAGVCANDPRARRGSVPICSDVRSHHSRFALASTERSRRLAIAIVPAYSKSKRRPASCRSSGACATRKRRGRPARGSARISRHTTSLVFLNAAL